MRRRLLQLAKMLSGGDELVQGSFEVTEETLEFTVDGLGFSPTGLIVCEDVFETVKKRTCGWMVTDIISFHLRYTTDTAANPAVLNQIPTNQNAFVAILQDGFTVRSASSNFPITPKIYNYIVW